MTRGEAIKDFFCKTILPVAAAAPRKTGLKIDLKMQILKIGQEKPG